MVGRSVLLLVIAGLMSVSSQGDRVGKARPGRKHWQGSSGPPPAKRRILQRQSMPHPCHEKGLPRWGHRPLPGTTPPAEPLTGAARPPPASYGRPGRTAAPPCVAGVADAAQTPEIMRASLHPNETIRKEVIRELGNIDVAFGRPNDHLLVQRNCRLIVLQDRDRLIDHRSPLR